MGGRAAARQAGTRVGSVPRPLSPRRLRGHPPRRTHAATFPWRWRVGGSSRPCAPVSATRADSRAPGPSIAGEAVPPASWAPAPKTGSKVPVPVVGGLTFTSLDVGTGDGATTCAVATNGGAYCWGAIYGYTGSYWSRSSNVPEAVPGGLVFASVTKGWGGLACGQTPAGVAYCWGHGWAGGLGNGSEYGGSSSPARVTGQ